MSAEIDWQRLAPELGLLRADVENGGSDYARRALELIVWRGWGSKCAAVTTEPTIARHPHLHRLCIPIHTNK
jgi:hypothetical protein